ncbi:MAG TPA: MraY family glycosyltransferase [Solirubrobacteraceae bacterium]|nr:MraY family glycosyltransferase [Solirubrobacteraceae bacterium]
MPPETGIPLAFVIAAAVTLAVTPIVIQIALRTSFLDRPIGYKRHDRPTPYLGGGAIMAGFLVAVLPIGVAVNRYGVVFACAGCMWLLGTIDDRRGLSPWTRVAVQTAAAAALWSTGHGWSVMPGDAANLLLTTLWIVGVVNAFNLMDNIDGACASVAGAAALGAGALAAVSGRWALAASCAALAGACAGFLPHNLRSPARVFMGDGGSMPLGLLVGALTMTAASTPALGLAGVVVASLIVGVVVLDATLVTVSRRRGGRPLLTGARDHLTHRLLTRIGSARGVAFSLAAAQLVLGTVTVALSQADAGWVLGLGCVALASGVGLITLLESSRWTQPVHAAVATDRTLLRPARSSPALLAQEYL